MVEASVGESLGDIREQGWLGDDGVHVTVILDILSTGFSSCFEELIVINTFGSNFDFALTGEVEAHGTGSSKRATVLGEGGAHVCCCTVTVIGQAFDDQAYAVWCVAFVHDALVVGATGFSTRTALDCTGDVVSWDGVLLRLVHSLKQGCVTSEIATTLTGCDFDVLDELGEELAALSVDCRLLVLSGGPLGMS